MITKEQWRKFIDQPAVEWTIFVLGILFMIAAIPVGALPGPGGVFVFAIGLAMVLKTSMWAKRRYVRFKRSMRSRSRIGRDSRPPNVVIASRSKSSIVRL